jgi:hypothetical protein
MTNAETDNRWRPPVGTRYLAPSGKIWTVRSITPRGGRVILTAESPDGELGAVMDFVAVSRMIPVDADAGASLDLSSREPQRPARVKSVSGERTPRRRRTRRRAWSPMS